jgi:hypothetical protein
MYSTVKEMHIAIDERLQQLNSNRKLSLLPQQKDNRLNEAVIQFINNKTTPKTNSRKEGFEDTQKRYDDIEELIRSSSLSVYLDGTNKVICPLPWDYYHLINDRTTLKYNCSGINYAITQSDITFTAVIPFPDDSTGSAGVYYSNFVLTVNGVSIYTSPFTTATLKSVDSKFMLINSILETLNIGGVYEVYWEYYLDHYEKNSFIIITPITVTTCSMTFNSITTIGVGKHYSYLTYGNNDWSGIITRSNSLQSQENIYDILDNYYYRKNMYLKPYSTIKRDFLNVFHDTTFIIKEVNIDYIKKPRLINYLLNQTCELSIGEEIIAIVVENIMADKTNDYQTFATERTIKE